MVRVITALRAFGPVSNETLLRLQAVELVEAETSLPPKFFTPRETGSGLPDTLKHGARL